MSQAMTLSCQHTEQEYRFKMVLVSGCILGFWEEAKNHKHPTKNTKTHQTPPLMIIFLTQAQLRVNENLKAYILLCVILAGPYKRGHMLFLKKIVLEGLISDQSKET